MQQAVQRGLRAGALAGLLLVGIFFVDYGPATNLSTVARWFALDGNAWSKLIGAILLVIVGAVFGGLFGIALRSRSLSLSQSVLIGLATGLGFWIVLVLLLSTVVRHIQQSLYGMLFWLVTSLLYGLVLGSLYGKFQKQEGAREL
jgi:predicted neutral ceramidase superfamily lipid hydrolase